MAKQRLKDNSDEGTLELPSATRPRPGAVSTSLRTMLLVLLDISGSMWRDGAIEHALRGLRQFWAELLLNRVLMLQLEFALVGITNGSYVFKTYGPADDWDIEAALAGLAGGNRTLTGEVFIEQMAVHEQYRDGLRAQGLGIRAELVVIVTDGRPNGSRDSYEKACRLSESFRARDNTRIFGIAVEGADLDLLSRLAPDPLELATLKSFDQLWTWIRHVSENVTSARLGEEVELPNPFLSPDNKDGWAKTWKKL